MQITLLFALLPLLAGIAQAQSQPGLDIRVVKDNSKRGSDDILARRAGENVVKSYAQCEQVCRAYFEPSDTPATEKAEPTVAQFAQSSAKSRRIAISTAAAVATSAAKPSSSDAAPPTANVNSAASTTDEQRMLTEHNTFRAKYGKWFLH
ncbi:hypothetical protein QFC19_004499 [Naganishia cerealis]|uniref:Uncharacterized protein n=1 Tax=Naganishia cerealis TaxID=610337 RepID=A0ACC2VUR8_9TREE|nr:hypothetical protein QFC19_004499 [Naganishia cerealis]